MQVFATTPDLAEKARSAARLAGRIQSGDAGAESELVERFSRGVRFLLEELTRDQARADDLHQETFRLVIEKIRGGELREPEKLPGFIRATARNLFIAEYRKAARRSVEDLDAIGAGGPADPAPSQLARVLQAEDAAVVRQLLGELEPPRYRELLFRFYVAEEPKERICADLGLESLQFNVVLHRARGRFKELLERFEKRRGRM